MKTTCRLYFASLCAIVLLPALLHAQYTGKVVSVADGDTFTILAKDNKQVKIRLHGIDCPEKKQDFGTKAKDYTSQMVFGKSITYIPTDTDRYGRTIAIIPMDGSTLNENLIRHGYAWHYCRYDKSEYWHYIQDSASAAKAGLWSIKGAVPPWEFRKTKS